MQVQPYLYFGGRTEEAFEFYREAVGAKQEMLMRFKDNPEPCPGGNPPGSENKVMHMSFSIGSTSVMASDGDCQKASNFDGFSLSINADTAGDAERMFAALGVGGTVTMPMTKTFFAKAFGMVKDKFGLHWMIISYS